MGPRRQTIRSESGNGGNVASSLKGNLFASKKKKKCTDDATVTTISTEQVVSPEQFREWWESSDERHTLHTKLHRMELAIGKLNQNQLETQTKVEVLHQATISLIRATVSTAILLLALLVYTLVMVAPSLNQNYWTTLAEVSFMSWTFVLTTITFVMFVIQFSKLFGVFLTVDNMMDGDDDDEEDDNSISSVTITADNLSPSRRAPDLGQSREKSVMMRRRSTILMEPLLSSTATEKHPKFADTLIKPTQQRQFEDLPVPNEWPHRPILLCANTPTDPSLKVESKYGHGPCPIGKPFWFSSDLFEGYCLVRIKNFKNSDDPESDKKYFDGRRRLLQTIVQGRFKEAMAVNTVLTGHEFVAPLKNLPHQWILKAATNLIGKLAPGSEICVTGDRPTMFCPLAGTSQVVRVDEPGQEPDIATIEGVDEDCTLLGGRFEKSSVSASSRKSYLANPKRSSRYTFDVDRVYTFDFYQNLLNVETYKLDLGIARISISPILNGQPIQFLAKTMDGRYLWSFQIWHESLLPERRKVSSDKKHKTV
jgi:hypothetical protein